ncbi:hypothetical protein XA68_12300 [Ophiocordyceps unilateralis]|uniref:Uncharacterized protein n=1 Tax=Ophiocordyceps unilateralis TaxID=268505 RepID=A0A2A9PD63_OPHUN|nr:hypothetical protein XA68_12300 [Ophiocordyceps unilateralis]
MASHKPVALVVGASRGIGRQVAIDLARSGYAVVVAAKSVGISSSSSSSSSSSPDPNSRASTITTVAREIVAAGGHATAIPVDVRSEESIAALVAATIRTYSRLDTLIYNAGAVFWASVQDTPLRRFQLMQRINPEGLYASLHAALPHLRPHGRVVVVCPPIYSRFFRGKTAYAMGKVAMSVLVKGLAFDFERSRLADMAVTGIWPAVAIESAATQQFTTADPAEKNDLRKPTIFSDAILAILASPPPLVNGELLLDEDFLRDHAAVSDFGKYSLVPGSVPRRIMPRLLPDLSVAEQADEGKRYDSLAKPSL